MAPEAYHELKKWMDFRAMYGEEITGESWVMRNMFKTSDVKRSNNPNGGGNNGRAERPRQLTVPAISRLLIRALYEQGIRENLEEGKKRHEFATCHSLRKYFKTRCELAGVKPINIENLMGHSTGIGSPVTSPLAHM